MNNQNIVKQLTFGVAFSHTFKVFDVWGEIADDILYNNKYFSSDFFPLMTSQYANKGELTNPDTKNQLIITANNLIFTQNINDKYEKEYSDFKNRVKSYIVPSILSRYQLNVRRLGLVYISNLDSDATRKFTSLFFKPDIQGINDFRFSKKEVDDASLVRSEKNDYINKIYSVGNVGNGKQGISYDYQFHFYPIREDVRNEIESFMAKADKAFSQDILSNLGK